MQHNILFTGHMIDAKDRTKPRFPAYLESRVKQAIYDRVLNIQDENNAELKGLASGACGGDILFHEVCIELGIPTEIFLPMKPIDFKIESVSIGGVNWEKRFDELITHLPVQVLPATETAANDNLYEATNRWMIDQAFSKAASGMTLLALWDGDVGDGKGGTHHMITLAKEEGGNAEVIDITKL